MSNLVSIIVNNYNLGWFLKDSIDSALAQSYANVEIIIVDDGSIDNSREIIEEYASQYGERIQAIFKSNGGQASALNMGFAQSKGDIVLFLDADDRLLPDTAARVAERFERESCSSTESNEDDGLPLAKLQFPLGVIDENGKSVGDFRTDSQQLPRGDLRKEALTFPDDLRWQPTSGNAFARWVLEQILPMPEAPYRLCADFYLSNIPPLLGGVDFLEKEGAKYRVHSRNNHYRDEIDLDQSREIIKRTVQLHLDMKRFAHTGGFEFPDDPTDVPSVTFIAQRLLSLSFAPAKHPIPGDTRRKLFYKGIQASLGRFDVNWVYRLRYAAWFCLFYFFSIRTGINRWSKCFAELFLLPEQRSDALHRLFPTDLRQTWSSSRYYLAIKHLLFW